MVLEHIVYDHMHWIKRRGQSLKKKQSVEVMWKSPTASNINTLSSQLCGLVEILLVSRVKQLYAACKGGIKALS